MATVNNTSNNSHPEKSVAQSKNYRLRRGVDKPFLAVIILLLCAGIVMVATASYVYAGSKKEFGYDNLYFFKRHVVFVIMGFLAMMIVTKIPYEAIRKFTPIIFLVSLLLLGIVLLMPASNGARRWIFLGPLSIQPSEIMKFAVIILCADYIDRFHSQVTLKGQPGSFIHIVLPTMAVALLGAAFAGIGVMGSTLFAKLGGGSEELLSNGEPNKYYGLIKFCDNYKYLLVIVGLIFLFAAIRMGSKRRMILEAPDFFFGILPFGILIVTLAVLLVLQPHMSGLIIITMIIVILMVVGGCSGRYLGGAVGIGSAGMMGLLMLLPHSQKRLAIWRDPFIDMQGDGWQPAQSLYAIGNGGMWGVGIGQSRQKQLYLPEPMNDYIFAILCEEFGFIGAIAVILLFIYLVYRGLVIAFHAPDRFSAMVVIGIVAQVGLQALLNMMVVTNTIPSTGISLPFFSYGGSSLMILLAEMGVVLSISRYSVIEKN